MKIDTIVLSLCIILLSIDSCMSTREDIQIKLELKEHNKLLKDHLESLTCDEELKIEEVYRRLNRLEKLMR